MLSLANGTRELRPRPFATCEAVARLMGRPSAARHGGSVVHGVHDAHTGCTMLTRAAASPGGASYPESASFVASAQPSTSSVTRVR